KDPWVETRLRTALMCVLVLTAHESPRTARSWFSVPNPLLDNCSPADVIRETPSPRLGERLLIALRRFCFGTGTEDLNDGLASETQLLSRATGWFDESAFDKGPREPSGGVLARLTKPSTRTYLRRSRAASSR